MRHRNSTWDILRPLELFLCSFLWLEVIYRLFCVERFFDRGLLYILLFSLPLSVVCAILSSIWNEKGNRIAAGVLLGQILANGFSGLSYGLLGSLSGAWVRILAAVHSVLISCVRKLDAERSKKWILVISIVFAVAYVVGSAVTYIRWPDAISCICALLFVLTVAQEDASKMRNVMLVSMSLWVFFDISVGAYTSIITHASTIVSIISAKLRLDKKTAAK